MNPKFAKVPAAYPCELRVRDTRFVFSKALQQGCSVKNRLAVAAALIVLVSPVAAQAPASRADRPSFGCGSRSDITDFGRAFFVNGLNHSDTFDGAFTEAHKLVDEWENRAGEEHSDPQISKTPQIEAQLRLWREGLRLGPAVPFQPAVPARARPASGDTLTAGVAAAL